MKMRKKIEKIKEAYNSIIEAKKILEGIDSFYLENLESSVSELIEALIDITYVTEELLDEEINRELSKKEEEVK